jgi:hypothetical protein
MMSKVGLSSLCKHVLEADNSIRFAGIANKFGSMIVYEYRKDLVPLLTENESTLSTIESVIRMNTRIGEKNIELKLGKPIYSFTIYEKIKRVTFLLDDQDYPILMISLNRESTDQESVVLSRILSIVKKENFP